MSISLLPFIMCHRIKLILCFVKIYWNSLFSFSAGLFLGLKLIFWNKTHCKLSISLIPFTRWHRIKSILFFLKLCQNKMFRHLFCHFVSSSAWFFLCLTLIFWHKTNFKLNISLIYFTRCRRIKSIFSWNDVKTKIVRHLFCHLFRLPLDFFYV